MTEFTDTLPSQTAALDSELTKIAQESKSVGSERRILFAVSKFFQTKAGKWPRPVDAHVAKEDGFMEPTTWYITRWCASLLMIPVKTTEVYRILIGMEKRGRIWRDQTGWHRTTERERGR